MPCTEIAIHLTQPIHCFNQVELALQLKLKLFDSLVGSVLNYGAEITLTPNQMV